MATHLLIANETEASIKGNRGDVESIKRNLMQNRKSNPKDKCLIIEYITRSYQENKYTHTEGSSDQWNLTSTASQYTPAGHDRDLSLPRNRLRGRSSVMGLASPLHLELERFGWLADVGMSIVSH